jgi:hypothetical protein
MQSYIPLVLGLVPRRLRDLEELAFGEGWGYIPECCFRRHAKRDLRSPPSPQRRAFLLRSCLGGTIGIQSKHPFELLVFHARQLFARKAKSLGGFDLAAAVVNPVAKLHWLVKARALFCFPAANCPDRNIQLIRDRSALDEAVDLIWHFCNPVVRINTDENCQMNYPGNSGGVFGIV